MSERMNDVEIISGLIFEEMDGHEVLDLEIGDYFMYLCGNASERVVIGKVVGFVEHFPFEDSHEDETITLPTVELWVECGNPPSINKLRKIALKYSVLFNPEWREQLDLFDRVFSSFNEGFTRISEEESDLICTKKYEQPFMVVRADDALEVSLLLQDAPPYAVYHGNPDDK